MTRTSSCTSLSLTSSLGSVGLWDCMVATQQDRNAVLALFC
jgi:hypothetical protein